MKSLQSHRRLWSTLPLVVASACSSSSNATLSPEAQAEFGSVEFTVVTVGAMLDPDGYRVGIDEERSQPIGINGTVEFNLLPVGFYEGVLSEVSQNCVVAAPNPVPITVSKDIASEFLFNVTCTAAP